MTAPDPAARHVIQRCPSCGVEHGVLADSVCEACHTPLRLWCSRHGRTAGWLNARSCARCTEAAARPAPAASPRPARPHAPRPDPPELAKPSARLARLEPSRWPGGRTPREILRGTPRGRDRHGLAEPLPPPQVADVISLGCGGAMFGTLAGWVAASVLGAGAAGAPTAGATVMGLGGLIVGIIRYVAIQRAREAQDEG